MNIYQRKNTIEPFNLFGENSLIFSKDQAEQILKDNSYYILFASFMMVAISLLTTLYPVDIGISKKVIIIYGIFYFILGISIRYFKSRIASLLSLISFCSALISKIIEQNTNDGWWLFVLIFIAASYRAVKASFYYHK